jgi:hypothetical protein
MWQQLQEAWENGSIHRYEMAELFVHRLIVETLAEDHYSVENPLQEANNATSCRPTIFRRTVVRAFSASSYRLSAEQPLESDKYTCH